MLKIILTIKKKYYTGEWEGEIVTLKILKQGHPFSLRPWRRMCGPVCMFRGDWLNGRESEWTPGVGDGQGGLECCDSWGHKESDMTERLNWTELKMLLYIKRNHQQNEKATYWMWEDIYKYISSKRKTLHMDITRWSTPNSDWLYSLQPKMEKLYTVSKNKTRSWLWLRPWTPYCQIQT